MDIKLGNPINSEKKQIEYIIHKTELGRYYTDVVGGTEDLFSHKLLSYGVVIGDLISIYRNPESTPEDKEEAGNIIKSLYRMHLILEKNYEAQSGIIDSLLK